jgi:hypothetical protein
MKLPWVKNRIEFRIVENNVGNYVYHLSANNHNAICGEERIMLTNMTMGHWGYVGHLNERYCQKCDKIYKNILTERGIK